jgi:predicted DCC family thiol-disulfide oxidoreductase YuxK
VRRPRPFVLDAEPKSRHDREVTGGDNRAVVLFDGTCAFCEGSVLFVARRDPAGRFRFAPSQSPQAEALLARYGVTRAAARSIILVDAGRVYLRSDAALRIAAGLTPPWSWLRVFLAVPRPIRDAVYRVVATVRHRIAGPSKACHVPPPALRSRLFLQKDLES